MRDQQVRRGDRRKVAAILAHEIPDDAAGDVLDVERPLAQVGIVDFAERFRVLAGHLAEDVLHRAEVFLKGAEDLVDEGAVFHHQQVRVEDAGIMRADGFGDFLLQLGDLLASGEQRHLEALDLAGDGRLLDAQLQRFVVLRAVHEDGAAGNARRDAHAVEAHFLARRRHLSDGGVTLH